MRKIVGVRTLSYAIRWIDTVEEFAVFGEHQYLVRETRYFGPVA